MKLHNPNEPASQRQLWYLHILTGENTRNLPITKVEASKRIEFIRAQRLLKNEIDVKPELRLTAKPKPKIKINLKRKSTIKVSSKSIAVKDFDCWNCHNGHKHESLLANSQPYILCGCGASTVELPRFKTIRNRRGGIKSLILSKPVVSAVTDKARYAMQENYRQLAKAEGR